MSLSRFPFRPSAIASLAALLLLLAYPAAAAPALLNHQGRMAVNGVNFDGAGQFKFALVNTNGSTTYWSNNGTSTAGSQPTAAVSLTVVKGLYNVLLGDTTLTNMTAVPVTVFDNNADVRLRVWFNDGTTGFQQITPDQRLAAAPWALNATNFSGPLAGDVTGTQSATAIAAATVTGKQLTGFLSTAGTITATDTILTAVNKLNGNVALKAPLASPVFTGTVTGNFVGNGSGLTGVTVSSVPLSSIIAEPAKPVVTWGDNSDGQNTVPPMSNVAAVSAGSTHRLVLLADNKVSPWGAGPILLDALNNGITHIAAGGGFNLARKSTGTVLGWGDNSFLQFTGVNTINDATNVAAGERHSLVLHSTGAVSARGNNSFGQLTVPVAATTGVTAIACGYDHSLALKSDSTVVAWGRNDAGQSTVPAGLTGVVAIGAGAYHSLAVKSDGTVVAWGWNQGGQSTVPPGLTGVSKVAGGYSFTIALKTNGTIVTWGDNSYGQADVPTAATGVVAIAASSFHAIALRAGLMPAQVARLDQENVFTEKLGLGRVPEANMLEVEGNASKSTAGSWLSNSDRRIKTEVRPLAGALEKLAQVRLVDFRYTDDYRAAHPAIQDKRYLNVIAQEFAKVFPDDVKSSGEKLPDGSPILQVDTYPLTIYSAAAVQELHRKIQAQQAALDKQRKEFDALAERFQKLEATLNQK